jgi:hypothetical protein
MPSVEGIRGKVLRTEKDGIVVIQIITPDRQLIKPFLMKYLFRAWDKAKKQKREVAIEDYPMLEFNFAFWYKKRTLDQNALYWALVTILGFEVFGEFHHEDEIHEEILVIYSPRVKGMLTKTSVPKRSKYLNTIEFSHLIEGVFKELAEHGVSLDSGAKIIGYWREWYTWRGTVGGDPLAGSYKNIEDYKERIPYCEACLTHLGTTAPGSIAHIVSKGAGGVLEDWNVFHLCDTCHTGLNPEVGMLDFDKTTSQHQHGWDAFLEKYPHLRWKYEKAYERLGLSPVQAPPVQGLIEDEAADAVPAPDQETILTDYPDDEESKKLGIF